MVTSHNSEPRTPGQRGFDKQFALLSGSVGTEQDGKDKVWTGEPLQRSYDRVVKVGPGRFFVYVHVGGDEELLDGRVEQA